MRQKTNHQGFTIVELLISTAVLSVILLAASAVVLQISRMYYKGVVLSKTQDAARNITESIARSIQFDGAAVKDNTTTPGVTITGLNDFFGATAKRYAVCVGDQRYSFVKNVQVGTGVGKIAHAVWRDQVTNADVCIPNTNSADLTQSTPPPTATGTSLIGTNMWLKELSVTSTGNSMWRVKVGVLYGDKDLMDPVTQKCKTGIVGGQWCASAEYETVVFKRIGG